MQKAKFGVQELQSSSQLRRQHLHVLGAEGSVPLKFL